MGWGAGADKALVPAEASMPLRPLLKWAGGKRQLLPALRPHYPTSFDRYIEPFVGSGAVFFDLYTTGRLQGRRARLVDLNPDLIGCYRAVRDQTEAVIDALRELEREHRDRGSDCYYDVRDRRFNPARAERSTRGAGAAAAASPGLAAMFIYLNRTGFNGLFRLNRQGGFNVPAGRYADPRICDADRVRSVARALSSAGVTIECIPFEDALENAGRGDFVYCDPPYAPLSRTASFAQYTAGGFGVQDHRRLQKSVLSAAKRGATVLMSNSSAPAIVAAYRGPAARRAGLTVHRIPARRAINSRAALRGPVEELIITNASTTARHQPGLSAAPAGR
ncbi:MAG: Dam family site-specific DNA-(adenine-N6)-methyltransferase [Acidobacteria bacterium]|nr:Dam family site-specific DNA-(adenine-N6)-methyltransferase [Acidobacteriota bacterium]